MASTLQQIREQASYYWWLLPVLLFLYLQARIWFDDTGVVANKQLEKQIIKLHSDNALQQSENQALLAEVLELRHGTELLEEKAREDLGLIRQNESFIFFADPEHD